MEITREINAKAKNGTAIRITIAKDKGVREKVAYSDGWNVPLGPETVNFTKLTVYVNGKYYTSSNELTRLRPELFKNDAELVAKGGYARLNKMILTKERYDLVMGVIAEMDAELDAQPEYVALKAKEDARLAQAEAEQKEMAAEYARQIENGLCPRCGTYCYGECTAN